ncbi:carbohydrate kinase family protein [Coprobacter fastidiosus]|jgi:fructokinase|uniref:carbohydrate kinase family protein n=1 Tax=Coprobacter fastidiosus TaxID=1099853 RepID=UPI0022E83853|nr:carbohydrate kinase [Coprobacter fastidiosus]
MNDVIVGMGEVLWDMLPEGKKIGGAPANFAYHVSQYGFDGCVVSAVGDDKLGNEILESFNNRRLNYLIQRVPYPTGTVQIELDEAGIPCYEIKENVAWNNIPFTVDLEKLAKKTRAVCFGSLAQRNTVSRETINRFLDVMSDAAGQYRVFDVNLRQGFYDKEILCNSMKRCNILKINDEELIAVSRMFEYPGINLEDKCRALLSEYGLEILILTCGVNGSYVFTRENVSFVNTPKIEVADTVGAGDSFTATFISAILKGKSIREAHELAVEVSAYVCTQNGAMPELPISIKSRLL